MVGGGFDLCGKAEGDKRTNAGMLLSVILRSPRAATGSKRHRRAKAESGEENRPPNFAIEPVESGENIADFGFAVVRTFAKASAPKIETQNRQAETERRVVEGLHCVVDNFVVKVAAEERVRVADERRERSA